MDYGKFYYLERYLLEEVGPRFRSSGILEPIDLFMIFIWKANRAKTRVRDNLKNRAKGSSLMQRQKLQTRYRTQKITENGLES